MCKILFCKHYFSPLNTFMRKGKDPNPYLWLTYPDPGSQKLSDPEPQHCTRLNSSCSSSPLQMPFWKGGIGQAAPVPGAYRLRPLQAHPSCLRRSQHQHPDKSVCQAPSQLQPSGQCRLVSPPEGAARNGTADNGCSRQHGGFPKTKYFYLA